MYRNNYFVITELSQNNNTHKIKTAIVNSVTNLIINHNLNNKCLDG